MKKPFKLLAALCLGVSLASQLGADTGNTPVIVIKQHPLGLRVFNDLLAESLKGAAPEADPMLAFSARYELLNDLIERVLLLDFARSQGWDSLPPAEELAHLNSLAFDRLREQVRKELVGSARIDRKHLQEFYDQNRSYFKLPERLKVRQIVLADEALAQSVYHQLLLGGDFSALAESHSQDPYTRSNGGYVGLVDRAYYGQEVGDILFSLPGGSISPILRTFDGYTVFMVEQRYPEEEASFEQMRREIQNYLEQHEREERYTQWLQREKELAHVKLPPNFFPLLQINVPPMHLDQPITGIDFQDALNPFRG